MPVDAAAAHHLGRLLTGTEAREVADRLADGDTLTEALWPVPSGKRVRVRALLQGAASECGRDETVAVLRGIEGARSTTSAVDPLWTMPGHLAQGGPLTSSVKHLAENARQSVTCSTFNFQRSSGLWDTLRAVARRPEVAVRVYVDANAADRESRPWSPTTAELARHLRPGIVLRTKKFDESHIRNHAKFLAVDHRFLLVTSANFSWSAEHGNVEFGVLVDDPNLTEAVEREMRRAEEVLYERVPPWQAQANFS